MAVWMQPIKLGYAKVKHEPHAVDEIRGTRCYGCPNMNCIPQRDRHAPWRYYCAALARRVEPAKLLRGDCPLGRVARGNPRRGRGADD